MSDSDVKKRSVMVLGTRGFPNIQGGVESHAEQLYQRISERGFQVAVLCRAPYIVGNHKYWNSIRIHRLWSPKKQGLEALLHSVVGVLFAAIKRPDILHIHAIGPSIVTPLARLFGLRVVVTHHGPDYEREKWGVFARFILKLGERLGMKFAHRRIVISDVIRQLVRAKYDESSVLIANGVAAPMELSTGGVLKRFDLEPNKYIVLVSRMVPEKRHLDLIKAFQIANIADCKLVLVGDISQPDGYIDGLVRQVDEVAKVVLTGFQSGQELADLLGNARVFVLPSSHEGLPIALLEAMSYGLALVASDIPAHLELNLDERCFFKLGDIDDLAVKLRLAWSDAQFREDQKQSGFELVESRYNWDKIADQTAAVYKEMVHR